MSTKPIKLDIIRRIGYIRIFFQLLHNRSSAPTNSHIFPMELNSHYCWLRRGNIPFKPWE